MKTGATTILKRTFIGLEEETLNTLRRVAQRRSYPPNTTLCHQGEIEHTFYIIVEGRVVVSQHVDGEEDRLLGVLGKNELFGEMSLIDDSPRMADCVTLTPTTVLEITEEEFDRLVESSPVVAYAVLRKILDNTRNLDRKAIEDLQAKNEALEQAYTALKAAQAELIEKERLERELELAAAVQRNLLPGRLPQWPEFEFAAYLTPARQVGGDFYDVRPLDDEHVGVLIADVADKGFHAALFMAVTRTLFLQESKHSLTPAAVAEAVHQGMLDVAKSADVFVTAFYGVLHRPSRRLVYVRAGHDRPLLFRPGEGVESLSGDGRFLGMWPELTLTAHTVQLQPGDRLLMYSDGVPDATNPSHERYGNERLQATLAENGQLPAPDLVKRMADDVADFCQDADPFDDLTLLALAVRE